jgi:hypothetical protein
MSKMVTTEVDLIEVNLMSTEIDQLWQDYLSLD